MFSEFIRRWRRKRAIHQLEKMLVKAERDADKYELSYEFKLFLAKSRWKLNKLKETL